MTLRHIALFRWQDGVTDAQIAEVERLLGALPAAVPELRSYTYGRDAGINEGTFDFAVTADFDDEAGFSAYRDHPEHQAALGVVRPLLADRAAVQFPLPG